MNEGEDMAAEEKRPVGRPRDPEYYTVPHVDATMEKLAGAMWGKMPKKEGEWDFQKKYGVKRDPRRERTSS